MSCWSSVVEEINSFVKKHFVSVKVSLHIERLKSLIRTISFVVSSPSMSCTVLYIGGAEYISHLDSFHAHSWVDYTVATLSNSRI